MNAEKHQEQQPILPADRLYKVKCCVNCQYFGKARIAWCHKWHKQTAPGNVCFEFKPVPSWVNNPLHAAIVVLLPKREK